MKQRVFFLFLLLTIGLILQPVWAQPQRAVSRGGNSAELLRVPPEKYVIIRALEQNAFTRVAPPEEFLSNPTPTASFDVVYNGFSPDAQAAFQHAVDIWASIISSNVTIKVIANWTPLQPGVLGSASAATLVRDFSGAPRPGTWYPIALAEKLANTGFNHPDSADIVANFNSNFSNWYLGTDGNPPAGQFDLVTVVLHELGHGLGFFGSMNVQGNQGSWGFGSGFPVIFDVFAENGAGQQLIDTNIFPNPSQALAQQLTGGDIFFDGPNANTGNGGTPPELYAPNPWDPGSSFSHLDEAVYPPGNMNSLMTPQLQPAEAIHNPGPVTLGIFDDIGWTTTPPPPPGGTIVFEEVFSDTTPPSGWQVVDNDGGGGTWTFVQGLDFGGGQTVAPESGTSFWWNSFNNSNGFLIDDWLISPQIPAADFDSLVFFAGAVGGSFPDSLRVLVSTDGTNFTMLDYIEVPGPIGAWHRFAYDISGFSGNSIYVAVNHYHQDGGPSGGSSDNVWVDHFIVTATTTGIEDEQGTFAGIPADFELRQNFPNPFNPTTRIEFGLPRATHVRLTVYNALGQQVALLVDAPKAAGVHTVEFDARNLPSGLYFYKLEAGNVSRVRKMLLMK